ncbi:hypothetical protein V6N11_068628 [Hibiscus sabdariffa]|uniref:Disease resistance N-terminal domain-containing protein n=1 Tax=Hibiscus sabdariffa TaxID=183260 RepID=A0ABR2PAM7_9ROSI
MAFIGDAALAKLLDLLLGKSIDAALNFVADHKQVYDQLKEWKTLLPDIKSVLNHAEEKQIKDEGVKSWLEDLQDLAYDADDILDEFAHEELRLRLQKTQAQASTSKVSKFPNLRKLSIRQCPQLLGTLPTHLQSLQRLEIDECRRLVVSISSFPSLRELSVKGCEELVDECSSSAVEEVSSLLSVSLSSISKFSIPAERIILRFPNSTDFGINDSNMLPQVLHAFTFLTKMKLEKCAGLISFAASNFPTALKDLRISDCDNLQYLFDESMSSSTCLLEHLEINGCKSLIRLSSRADICNRLQNLQIHCCPKFTSLFLNSKLPVMLKELIIWGCPELECIAQDFHETTDLEIIVIADAQNIKSLPLGLDKLSHLQGIRLQHCSNLMVCFDEIEFSTANLRDFFISGCENFRSLPMCINNFSSLDRLRLWNCWTDISFPEEGFPTNLTSLSISGAPKIYGSLVEWGFYRLTSLQDLSLGCLNVVSFPEERTGMSLPDSLTSISICVEESVGFKNSNEDIQLICFSSVPPFGLKSMGTRSMLMTGRDFPLHFPCLIAVALE